MKHVRAFSQLWLLWGQALALLPAAVVTHSRQSSRFSAPIFFHSPQYTSAIQDAKRERWRDQELGMSSDNYYHRTRRKGGRRPGYNGRRRQGKRTLLSRRQADFEALLKNYEGPQDIDLWMKSVNAQPQNSSLSLEHPIDSSWSSRDETDFIRHLRDRGAYKALERFACYLARRNVYVFTAAIAALASSQRPVTRKRALLVLERMDETGVQPSSFTFAALFQSIDGPEEARKLMGRLQQYKGITSWSVASFNQAILACARKDRRQQRPTNRGWQVALEFLHNLRTEGLTPDWKTYTSLLKVCAQTGQLKIALSLAREIESIPDTSKHPIVLGALLNVCAQAGDYNQAQKVLLKMQKYGHPINLADYSALLKALSRNGLVKTSFEVLDVMTESDRASVLPHAEGRSVGFQMENLPPVAPDLVALNTVLACCAKAKDFHAARQLLDCMRNGEFCDARSRLPMYPDEISYSLLLSSCSNPMAARAIVKEMQLSRRYRVGVVRPSNITYARAIAVCRKADIPDVETARFFLSSARNDGVEPTVFMYTAAIWTAERSGNYTFAAEVLQEMKSQGVKANCISYTGVISAAARGGRVDEAIALYEEFKEGGVPSPAMYNALAMAVRHTQPSNKLKVLKDIFAGMDGADRFVEIGGPVIEALISEYGRFGFYENATRVFESINGPCNAACLRAILGACATAEPKPKWQEAVSLLHSSDITRSSTGSGQIEQGALGLAMIACAKADKWEEGLNLLLLYGVRTKRSSSLSNVALNAVMAACGRNGRPDVAVSILNEMEQKYGVKPDERSYRSAIIACNQAEHQRRRHKQASSSGFDKANQQWDPEFQWWECALALLRRMKETDLSPDIQTLSSCISACEAAGQWQRALGVLQSMIDENSEEEKCLNLFCFNAAISSCEKGGAWIEALEIYERMISYGGSLHPNFVSLSSLVLALANAGQRELAEGKYKEGIKLKLVNPWRLTKDGRGQRLKAMDLHKFNSAMACSAVRSHLDSLLVRGKESIADDDLVIIVGKGLRSSDGVKLFPAIQRLLLEDYGISVDVDEENRGRVVITTRSLQSLIARRSWS